ncbi:MAG: LytR/AlgR family response regulator transcription factor [Janthinobacterium lividum]
MAPTVPLRCLLVDDELLAHTVLRTYIDRLPDLVTWVGSCYRAVEALTLLRQTPVDVLFLDVNMPGLTGLELLRTLPQPPAVVLCTAYSTHAIDAFELGVVDYLLKPIRFERFVKTINRLHIQLVPGHEVPTLPPVPAAVLPTDTLFLKTDAGTERVRFGELLFVEGCGNFIKCHLAAGRVLLSPGTLKQLATQLPLTQFLRAHKSYLVNLTHVERLQGNTLLIGTHALPIGNAYRQAVLRGLGLA